MFVYTECRRCNIKVVGYVVSCIQQKARFADVRRIMKALKEKATTYRVKHDGPV